MCNESKSFDKSQSRTCCVTGHRDIPDDQLEYVKKELRKEIDQALEDGYTHYISGFADGVDQYFAEIVAEKRQANEKLQLEAAVPYRKRMLALCDNADTMRLLMACTIIGVHGEAYTSNCFTKRNRFMVTHSSRVIAVYDGREKGGTLSTMRMAQRMRRQVREISVGLGK